MPNNLSFEVWLDAVNAEVANRIGISGSELADWNSWDTWDSGASVSEGADEAISSDDLGGLFDF